MTILHCFCVFALDTPRIRNSTSVHDLGSHTHMSPPDTCSYTVYGICHIIRRISFFTDPHFLRLADGGVLHTRLPHRLFRNFYFSSFSIQSIPSTQVCSFSHLI
ncbi:hypothetical protein AA313_de0202081 [Arthrobotrys entomopaga]|nr:hypothetical protein AA313_de0202081 [Arthrobotrys entomopaga]